MAPRLIGVIPAAGQAARLQPTTGSKELISIGGQPVFDHLLERLQVAGCDEIRVTTRPDKVDVIEHCARQGLSTIVGEPPSVAASLSLAVSDLDPTDTVLFGFPDSLWEPADGFVQLARALEGEVVAALGLFLCCDLERSDVVTIGQDGFVLEIQVKPTEPRSDLVWGCAAATAGALHGLQRHDEPGHLFAELASERRVRGIRFAGEFVDIGTPETLTRLGVVR